MMSGQVSDRYRGNARQNHHHLDDRAFLLETVQYPSYIIGGILRNTGHNAGLGTGQAFVIEADEYDHMFLGLRPEIAVVTNVEYDHPDFFKTPDELVQAFNHFVDLLPDDGSAGRLCR